MRDCLLFLHFFEESGDVKRAFRRTRTILGNGSRWDRALPFVREQFGISYDDALTEDGEDAFDFFERTLVIERHQIVHGHAELHSADHGDHAIAFVDRFISWFTQRLLVSDKGPLRGVLLQAFESARRAFEAEQSASALEQPQA